MRGQRLAVAEKERLTELLADQAPFPVICELIDRDRWTTRRNTNHLKRKPPLEPTERHPSTVSSSSGLNTITG